MSKVDITYVAAGFIEDCTELIHKFIDKGSIRFQDFCETWSEMKFSLVFL